MDGHEHDGSEHYDGDTPPPSPADPEFSDETDFYDNHGPFWESDHDDHVTVAAEHDDPDWPPGGGTEHQEAPDLYSDAHHPTDPDAPTDPADPEPGHDAADLTHPPSPALEPGHPAAEPEAAPAPGPDAAAPDPTLEPAFGSDPDLPPASTHPLDAWLDLPDVAHLTTVPEPAGGAPWIDTDLLGPHLLDPADASGPADTVAGHPVGALDDLRAALGEPPLVNAPHSAFQELLTSHDPAVRALAHLWASPA